MPRYDVSLNSRTGLFLRMSPASQRRDTARDGYVWRTLGLYSLYRIFVAGGLVLMFESQVGPSFLGAANPLLYRHAAYVFLLLVALSLPLLLRRQPRGGVQALAMALVDIGCITLAVHASAGVATGLAMLLAVSITAAALVLGRAVALALAALASVALLAEQAYAWSIGIRGLESFTQVGVLGAVFFAMSMLAVTLAKRVRESEAAAETSRAEAARFERLNEHIIQFMNTGVLVVDRQLNIQQINHAAWTLLGMPHGATGKPLEDLSAPLLKQLRHWRRNPEVKGSPFRAAATGPDLLPTFTSLGGEGQLTLVFLEDTSKTTQQATQMKLASLGRLTASIAHEIRNPLGALSHAAQLLRESPDLTPPDAKLVDIIDRHTARMNNIIENILQMSQRRPSQPERIALLSFLQSFLDDFKVGRNPAPEIKLDVNPRDVAAMFDIGQLIQVLTNLCDNGIRYSIRKVNRPLLEVHAGIDPGNGRPYVDVIDYGEGINPDVAEKMFEPFFTTSSKGLGLGLYLTRELCEANRAHIAYLPIPSGGSCFRVSCVPVKKVIPVI